MASKIVEKIRTEWGKSDQERDAGLLIPENVVRHKDLSYGPYGSWNLLDIYYEAGVSCCQPTIVSVHGGAWVYGSKELYQYYCMGLAKRGFTVVNFNYRLASEYRYPAPLEDLNRVLCFLKEQGEKYRADTDRLVLVGDSAGAQILSQYLTAFTNPEYAAFFDFTVPEVVIRAAALNCGIYDVRKCEEAGLGDMFCEYAGKDIMKTVTSGKNMPESLKTMNYMTRDFPPSYIMTAYHDYLKENAKSLYDHLTEQGAACEYKMYGSKEQEEIAHVFHVNGKLKEAAVCNKEECDFFCRCLTEEVRAQKAAGLPGR